MRLKVFERPSKGVVNLELIQSDDEVYVAIIDEDGDECETLLSFEEDGGISLHGDISNKYGFKLDDNKRIKLNNK